MNSAFLNGFIKSAAESGLSRKQIMELSSVAVTDKVAADEMPMGMPQEGDPSQGGGMGGEGDNIEQLLAQLSPEELEQLATELAADQGAMEQGGEMHQGPGGGEEDELAAALAHQLASQQGPAKEAAEQMAKLAFAQGFEEAHAEYTAAGGQRGFFPKRG